MTIPTTDKAVILARGLGTRMRKAEGTAGLDSQQAAIADTGVKALIPIGRPFLDYSLSALADAGYRRICLVIGPKHEAIRQYYGRELKLSRLTVEFAVQEEPKGTANAVAAAEAFAGDDYFLVINSDNYYPVEAMKALRMQERSATALFDWDGMLAGNVGEDRLRKFAVAETDAAGNLQRLIEKPDDAAWLALPRPIWVSMNCWRFGPKIFEACRNIKLSPRGELELPSAVQYLMDVLGEPVRVVSSHEPVLDLTSRADIAPLAAKLAEKEVNL
jgi:dTDP-glucose pyrophosphorylase